MRAATKMTDQATCGKKKRGGERKGGEGEEGRRGERRGKREGERKGRGGRKVMKGTGDVYFPHE